jgi:hypothetical protein
LGLFFEKIRNTISQKEWLLFIPLAALTHISFIYGTDLLKSDSSCLLNDSWLIHNLAKSFAETGSMLMNGEATLYQFPVYPLYISVFYNWFGIDPRYVLWSQIGMSILLINLAVRMTRKPLGLWRFLLGFLLCFDLHQVLYSSCLLTEFWVMTFWVLGLFFYLQYRIKKRFLFWCISISIFTFAANIKPLSLFLPLFLTFGLGLFNSKNVLNNLKLVISGCLIFILGMLPLLYRNYLISDQFPLLTTNSALALWYYNLPYARAKIEGRNIQEIRVEHVEVMRQYLLEEGRDIAPIPRKEALSRHGHREALGLNEFEYAVIANKLCANYLKNNFLTYVKVHLLSGLQIFTASNLSWLKLVYTKYDAVSFSGLDFKTLKEWNKNSDVRLYFLFSRIYELSYTFVLLGLSMLSCLYLILKKKFTLMHWACWLVIFYMICITGLNTWGRFRFLMMPILMYLGVEGLRNLFAVMKSKTHHSSSINLGKE